MAGRQRETVAALLLVACLGCVSAGVERAETERELLARVQTSNLSQDHEALALFYREWAQAMEEKAALHERSAKRYAWRKGGARLGRIRNRALAASYRRSAAEYRALAVLHETHAGALQGQPK